LPYFLEAQGHRQRRAKRDYHQCREPSSELHTRRLFDLQNYPLGSIMDSVIFLVSGSKSIHQPPTGYGHPLAFVYLMWLTALLILYIPCNWYAAFKSRHRDLLSTVGGELDQIENGSPFGNRQARESHRPADRFWAYLNETGFRLSSSRFKKRLMGRTLFSHA
jgi:hypothetical protein